MATKNGTKTATDKLNLLMAFVNKEYLELAKLESQWIQQKKEYALEVTALLKEVC